MIRRSKTFATVLAIAAGPAAADEALLGYMGGQGCTFGVDSMVGAVAAGFDAEEIDLLISNMLNTGQASQQGIWVVLDKTACTIRLPDIQSELTVESPEIQAIAPYIREEYDLGDGPVVDEGCFMEDAFTMFEALSGGDPDRANADYLRFLGASMIAGEARFYSTSPLSTPRGLQVMTGECARAPNVATIQASQAVLANKFGDFVRQVGPRTPCGEDLTYEAARIVAQLQGVDVMADDLSDEDLFNAWLYFEWTIISMAAGWYEGMSATERGTPRPPLCHYPDG